MTITSYSRMSRRVIDAALLATICASFHLAAFAADAIPMMGQPPDISEPVPPNMVFTLDDSGSMWWECPVDGDCRELEITPARRADSTDNLSGTLVYDDVPVTANADGTGVIWSVPAGGNLQSRKLRTNEFNKLYYDPSIRYYPWLTHDGDHRYDDATPEAAKINGPNTTKTINITGIQKIQERAQATDGKRGWYLTRNNNIPNSGKAYQSAHIARYYIKKPGTAGNNPSHFVLVKIEDGRDYPFTTDASGALLPTNKAPARTDCIGNRCTYEEEIQNFANWYTYYRTRALTAIAGTLEAFAQVPPSYRVGYGRINQKTATTDIDGVNTMAMVRGVRPFTGADKEQFYTWLAGRTKPSGNTPLRRAMDDVGQYFMRQDNKGPWGDFPGFDPLDANGETADRTKHVSCRRAIHVLMTDGFWNDATATTPEARENVDNQNGPLVQDASGNMVTTYTPKPPYKDTRADMLADVAMYYWSRDLRPDLPNNIKPITSGDLQNPAFWQHMVNFTIAFGVSGSLNNPGDLPALTAGTKNWGSNAVDDLWHAAINSRGRSLSARNAPEFADALGSIIEDIGDMIGSESGIGVSTTTLPPTGSASKIYTPSYSTPEWNGDVVADNIDSNGNLIPGAPAWAGASGIPTHASRTLFTWDFDDDKAVNFKWSDLSTSLQQDLMNSVDGISGIDGEDLVDFIRGSNSHEGAPFRERKRASGASSPLGDIVNSTPAFVSDQLNLMYQFLPAKVGAADYGREKYKDFLQAKSLRQAQIIVGANDGMLHSFSDADGTELFGFVPGSILNSLAELADPDYTHRYFVDGPIHETDAYNKSTEKWQNLVLGTGGAGGKYVYTINMPVVDNGVTTPLTAALSAPTASDILWEINSDTTGFEELGYVLSNPETGVTRDGTWVTIFGNGYNSPSGKAQLFIVDAFSGALIKRIDTNAGSTSEPNGLGGVGVVRDANLRIVAAYAGDLQGNLWKFDLSSTSQGNWDVAFNGESLFKAKNSNGDPEPITVKPNFRAFPTGGVLVLFGSGQMFAQGDLVDTDERALYGIWDHVAIGGGAGTSSDVVPGNSLVEQSIVTVPVTAADGSSTGNYTYRKLDITPVNFGAPIVAGGPNIRGWRLPLTLDPGERMIDQPQIRYNRVFMQTVFTNASEDPCVDNALNRRAYMLDPFMSNTLAAPFDADGDGIYESSIVDLKSSGENILVNKSGLPLEGVIKGAGDPSGPVVNFGDDSIRRTWREIVMHP